VSERVVATILLALQREGERLAIHESPPALTRRLLAILLGHLAIVRGQPAELRRLRASLHGTLARAGGANDAFRSCAVLVVIVLGDGVVPRHRTIARFGGLVSGRRRDIAVVGDRIALLGGIQPRPRAGIALEGAVLALVSRMLAYVAAEIVRTRVASSGKITVARGLVAIGRELVPVGARLVVVSACLVAVCARLVAVRQGLIALGPRLVAIHQGLVALSERPFVLESGLRFLAQPARLIV